MNVLILTQHLENYDSLEAVTGANKRAYAERHGYSYFAQRGHYWDFGVERQGSERFDYQRIKLIYDVLYGNVLSRDYDVVWWTGCDTIILDQTRKVEAIIEENPNKGYFIAKDCGGFNNDSTIWVKSEWTKRWLEFLLSVEPQYRSHPWESQWAVIQHAETPEWAEGVCIVPQVLLNAYFYDIHKWPETTPGHAQKGSWLLHIPGSPLDLRLQVFQSQRVADLMIT